MTLEVFNYPYHSFQTTNPESGIRAQLGSSYIFATPPTDPDQRTIVLTFVGMQYFTDDEGVLDENINPTRNMLSLINFYQRNKLYKSFEYPHPVHGTLVCKFNKPLVEETVLQGGYGVVKEFTIEIIEIP